MGGVAKALIIAGVSAYSRLQAHYSTTILLNYFLTVYLVHLSLCDSQIEVVFKLQNDVREVGQSRTPFLIKSLNMGVANLLLVLDTVVNGLLMFAA